MLRGVNHKLEIVIILKFAGNYNTKNFQSAKHSTQTRNGDNNPPLVCQNEVVSHLYRKHSDEIIRYFCK